jgi:hypothetical protein
VFSADAFREQLLNAGRAVRPPEDGCVRRLASDNVAFRQQVADAHASQVNVVLNTPEPNTGDDDAPDNIIPFPTLPIRRAWTSWLTPSQ